MSKVRLISLRLASFRVKVKVKGKWRAAKKTARSFAVPKGATKYRVEYKPGTRWLKVAERDKKRGKSVSLGFKKLQKILQSPDKVKRKYKTAYDFITAELGGDPWQLRPRAQRVLPQWASKDRFFNTEADLDKEWDTVAIWYAIAAEGFSDGTAVEGNHKAWYVDAAYIGVAKSKLSGDMIGAFRDRIADEIVAETAAHNDHKGASYQWLEDYRLLAVEGVQGEVSRTGRVRRAQRRFGPRRKVSKAAHKNRIRH